MSMSFDDLGAMVEYRFGELAIDLRQSSVVGELDVFGTEANELSTEL